MDRALPNIPKIPFKRILAGRSELKREVEEFNMAKIKLGIVKRGRAS